MGKLITYTNMLITSFILNIILILAIAYIAYTFYLNSVNVKLEKMEKEENLIKKIDFFLPLLEKATTLHEIYALHIQIWANGIQHEYIGPCDYGMFRTKDILTMQPNEVYLGNIWGLFTKNLEFWENAEENDKNIVTEQYKNHLIGNLKMIKQSLYKEQLE